MKSLNKKEQGFTLIEIVIVLAIAAAIILMVFLAVTGVRKSQRDTQRRSDAGRMAATLEQYASNYGGAYPASTGDTAGWFAGYVQGSFKAPAGASYSLAASGGGYASGWQSISTTPAIPTAAAAVVNGSNLNQVDLGTGTTTTGSAIYSVCISGESTNWVCATSN